MLAACSLSLASLSLVGCLMPDSHQPAGFSSTYYKALQHHTNPQLVTPPAHETYVPGTPPPGMHLPIPADPSHQPQTQQPSLDGQSSQIDPSLMNLPQYGATPKSGYFFGFTWPDFSPPEAPVGTGVADSRKSYLQFSQPVPIPSSATAKRKKS
jgi:hypothetical protein